MTLTIGDRPTTGQATPQRTCAKCGGAGRVATHDGHAQCQCVGYAAALKQLGEPLASAYWRNTKADALMEYRAENLMLTGPWEEVATYLAYVCFSHIYVTNLNGQKWQFRLTTDEDLRSAYFSTAEGFTEEVTTYERGIARTSTHIPTHRELASPENDLLIVQLGYGITANPAMPGVLHWAIQHRRTMKAPTWLVATPEDPLKKGHLAWSEKVDAEVSAYFRRITW